MLKMRARAKLFILMSILSVTTVAQSRFSVEDTLRIVSGGTSWGVLHHFIQAHNQVGDTLNMRWIKRIKGNPPAAWLVNFSDPESNHPDLSLLDSTDFILADSASNHTYNKFVIGINPRGALGTGQYTFSIFETQFPADSVRISYSVEVYTGIGLPEWTDKINAYPNPANDFIRIPSVSEMARVSLYDLTGREVSASPQPENYPFINVSALPSGNYLIRVEEENKVQLIKITIEH